MTYFVRLSVLAALIVGLVGFGQDAPAQFGKLKDKVKNKVEKKIDDETDEKIDEALEGNTEKKSEQESSSTAAKATEGKSSSAKSLKPGEGAWLNYDFVPGNRVLYFEDFSKVPVGDFPHRIEFIEGNMEVAEWEGSRYLRIPQQAKFEIPLPENLPEKFTLEMEVYIPKGNNLRNLSISEGSTAPEKHFNQTYFVYTQVNWQPEMESGLRQGSKWIAHDMVGNEIGLVDLRLMMSGKYAKVYVNEMRVANVPNAEIARADRLLVDVGGDGDPVMIGAIRVAEGGKTILYEELTANGRVATRGIYFNSGSDNLRPESTPTLTEIGTMLQQHADLRVLIEGHTDNQGDPAYNSELSEKRAAAVKAYLIETYGVDSARLETKGFGESIPVDSNDTPEGRQNNRRVELVKLS
jgi:outer membrane protein OmpA-like peptidoglycan-associated protein